MPRRAPLKQTTKNNFTFAVTFRQIPASDIANRLYAEKNNHTSHADRSYCFSLHSASPFNKYNFREFNQ